MLRDTCPEDMDEIDLPPVPRPPSMLLMVGLPMGMCLAVVVVAWTHTALGSPLGPAWGAEVWGLAKAGIWATLGSAAFGAWARRQNERALAELRQARREVAALSASRMPVVRQAGPRGAPQTGPHRTLQTGRHRALVEPEVEDEEGAPW